MKSKTGKIILCAVLAVILGVVVFVSCTATQMMNSVNHVEVPEVQETEAVTEAPVAETETAAAEETEETEEAAEETTEPEEEVAAYNDPDATNYLVVCKPVWKDGGTQVTDTMILCSLNEKTKAITMTALNAAAEVDVPEYKGMGGNKAPLNTVYGMGNKYGTAASMELLNQTLYNNYGIKVDENLEFDMKLFSIMVRKIDGVEIELTEEEAKYLSEQTGKEISAGVQQMDGNLADAYVEMWGAGVEGVSAISGQKKMVEAIVKTVTNKNVNNLKVIVLQLLPNITTSMNRNEIEEVLFTLLPLLRDLSIVNGGICPAA